MLYIISMLIMTSNQEYPTIYAYNAITFEDANSCEIYLDDNMDSLQIGINKQFADILEQKFACITEDGYDTLSDYINSFTKKNPAIEELSA